MKNIELLTGKTKEFAIDRLEGDYTIDEIEQDLKSKSSIKSVSEFFEITEEQWLQAMNAVLADKLAARGNNMLVSEVKQVIEEVFKDDPYVDIQFSKEDSTGNQQKFKITFIDQPLIKDYKAIITVRLSKDESYWDMRINDFRCFRFSNKKDINILAYLLNDYKKYRYNPCPEELLHKINQMEQSLTEDDTLDFFG